jgi:hypothetical protein
VFYPSAAVPNQDAKSISPEGQEVLGHCVKRVDWASKALTAAGEDLRQAAPDLEGLSNYLTATGEQLVGVERALRGG